MASSYSTSLKIQLMTNGEDSGTWGTYTNTNWNLIEQAVAGVVTITMSNANYLLSNLNGVSDEARNMVLVVNGTTNGAGKQVVAPQNQPKFYIVSNQTTDGYSINIGAASGSVITIPNGVTAQVYTDGTNFYSAQTGSAGPFVVNGTLTATGLTDTGNMSIGGTLAVTGTTTHTGAVALNGGGTSTTVSSSDNSTNIATTAFVKSITGSLGTMSTQNANAVAITGGTITGSYALTAANATNATTATTATNATNASNSTTQSTGTNNTTIATTAYVQDAFLGSASQSWQDVSGSRNYNQNYTNSTGRPIMVAVSATFGGGAAISAIVNGVTVAYNGTHAATEQSCMTFIVPIGATYQVASSGGFYSQSWAELR